MSQTLTRAFGEFVSNLRLAAIPNEALGVVHTGFADCVGTMIAGSVEDPPNILHKTLAPPPGRCQPLSDGPARAGARSRLDQRHGGARARLRRRGAARPSERGAGAGDPGGGRGAGRQRRADGHRLRRGLRGVGRPAAPRAGQHHHEKGWHPTGIFGAIAAAAACASLRGLDAEKATHAIALGASQSAGLMANFGTMTKPFHAGKAAHAGVIAARLAACRLHRLARRAGASAGLPRGRLAQGRGRPRRRRRRRAATG